MNSVSVKSSRLQAVLSELALGNAELSHKNFAEKLGQLIDLSGSIALAESLRGLQKLEFTPATSDVSALKSSFLTSRAEMLAFILNSFITELHEGQDSSAPFILPRANAETLADPEAGFQAYQRFYNLHQSQLDHRVLVLRRQLQEALAGQSPQLAQLAELDRSLADKLGDYTRKVFASIPRLLAQRFYYLNQQYRAVQEAQRSAADDTGLKLELEPELMSDSPALWMQKGAWLDNFFTEMQGLLLAELELRLMPVMGLLEVLEVEVETQK
ncbi:hypothetical protein HNQ57_003192 [Zhongshania antarctica]|uniref:DUF3348 domain-containing protein n=1 Tax=Zhongshania antarctica TaxID=641702 RepID=A0A840R6M6_9GAMM|nr:DUF3348 family protein [Zhongshania antarctica]MBB5188895.1 hypothetical protein [Zhongshania antarctica]